MVRIISDSSTLFSKKQARILGIDIAPLSVTINGQNYKEFEEISTKELIEKISAGGIPTSSQPSVGEFLDIYNQYPDDELIVITMADGLSGTYNSACLARNLCGHSQNITVVNSHSLCGPQREMVLKALRLSMDGYNKSQILSDINRQISNTYSFLIPRDFSFLRRGGRLSPLAAKFGSLINLVPVMAANEEGNCLVSFSKQRTFSKAASKISTYLKEQNVDSTYKLYICHAGALQDAKLAAEILSEALSETEIEILLLSPVFTTQGGPKCISIQAVLK